MKRESEKTVREIKKSLHNINDYGGAIHLFLLNYGWL